MRVLLIGTASQRNRDKAGADSSLCFTPYAQKYTVLLFSVERPGLRGVLISFISLIMNGKVARKPATAACDQYN